MKDMRHPSTTDSHAAHPLESACRPVRTAQARIPVGRSAPDADQAAQRTLRGLIQYSSDPADIADVRCSGACELYGKPRAPIAAAARAGRGRVRPGKG
ncbi:hypothetical protein DRB96_40055 [Streptomyces sp. ICC1]|nr:hypothetical protein DRB89_07980 [Streptomyces sp. ICC4]AWZ17302.1 hypothetical protein DRB96_40055 [Streptomyces sp. ICC1]